MPVQSKLQARSAHQRLIAALASATVQPGLMASNLVRIGVPVLLAFLVWVLRKISQQKPKRGHHAPGPPLSNFSLIGHGLTIFNRFKDLQVFYDELVKKYGKTVRLVIGPPLAPLDQITIVTSPDNVRHLLKDNFDNYVKGEKIIEWTLEMTGLGIFGTDGEEWYKHRKTSSRIFTSENMSTQMTKTMLNNFDQLIQAFRDAGKGGTVPVDIEQFFLCFTMDTFCEIGFGVTPGTLKADANPEWKLFAHSWDGLQSLCPSRTFQPLWKVQRFLAKFALKGLPVGFLCGPEVEIAQMYACVNRTLDAIVQQRKRDGAMKLEQVSPPKERGSTTPGAVSPKTTSPSSGSPGRRKSNVSANDDTKRLDLIELFMGMTPVPTDLELRDSVKSLLLGGRDTTGATLTWTFYEIARKPHVAAKLREEAANLPTDDAEAFYKYVKDMKYTDACIKETVRLHTPVAIDGKAALADDVMPDGTFIAKGSMVCYPPFVMARDPDLWGSDCLEYRPERWLEMTSEPSPYVYSQFQAGPRICLGKDLAILESKGVVALIMKAGVKMEWWEGTPAPQYKMAATVQVQPPGMLMKITVD